MVQISPTIKKIKISEKYIVVCPYVTQRRFFILRPAYSFRMSNGYSMDIFVGDSGNIPKKTFTSATSGYYGGYPVGYSLEYYLAIRGIFLCSLGSPLLGPSVLLVLYGYKTCTKSKTLAFVWFSYLIQ
jgi:hypothetical protein